ncbi:hypothetical protein [Hymenobacter sp. BT190]|uniref:hypothetical protein n=1 Tax=Hymenobacter sp. BT190 TaxID=2763505 RepID=UPI00165147D0|nr:hypothetical protein [Hymenobacter sp. BT190]MBC6698499.1 hypothetical protein [Hymenobacter sp. BT190]
MRPELERLQHIESYLLAPGSAPDATLWAARQLLDPALRLDMDTQQLVYRGLQIAGRKQLLKELSSIHAALYGGVRPPRRWLQHATAALQQLRRQLGRRN